MVKASGCSPWTSCLISGMQVNLAVTLIALGFKLPGITDRKFVALCKWNFIVLPSS